MSLQFLKPAGLSFVMLATGFHSPHRPRLTGDWYWQRTYANS